MNIERDYNGAFRLYVGERLLFGFDKGFPDHGFAARLHLGGGAGYRGGATAFLAWRSGSRWWTNRFRGGQRINGKPYNLFTRLSGIELGLTRNANIVPHMSH